jgi:hypothetical protein
MRMAGQGVAVEANGFCAICQCHPPYAKSVAILSVHTWIAKSRSVSLRRHHGPKKFGATLSGASIAVLSGGNTWTNRLPRPVVVTGGFRSSYPEGG